MSLVRPVDEPAASGRVAELYAELNETMGIPGTPNFFTALGSNESVLEGTWTAEKALLFEGELPLALKQMIFLGISNARECAYCDVAHQAMCRMLGVSDADVHAIIDDIDSLMPERTRAIIAFAVRCALEPQSIAATDIDALRGHGIDDSEILEIIAMSGFAVYCNILADGLKIDIDASMRAQGETA